jgi:hypothetical protein
LIEFGGNGVGGSRRGRSGSVLREVLEGFFGLLVSASLVLVGLVGSGLDQFLERFLKDSLVFLFLHPWNWYVGASSEGHNQL